MFSLADLIMELTFHLVEQPYFESLDANRDYVPEAFAREGFIHCTDGAVEMARIANLFYRANSASHLYLYIDKTRVRAPIKYEDPQRLYPHVYGPLNRDAIIAIRLAQRAANWDFLPPEMTEGSKQ